LSILPELEVVDDQHLPFPVQENLGEMAPDEAGASGDDCLTGFMVLIVVGGTSRCPPPAGAQGAMRTP
jgi:hypothetical protein